MKSKGRYSLGSKIFLSAQFCLLRKEQTMCHVGRPLLAGKEGQMFLSSGKTLTEILQVQICQRFVSNNIHVIPNKVNFPQRFS